VVLVVEQAASSRARGLSRTDNQIVTSWLGEVECVSAVARLERLGELQGPDLARAWADLRDLLRDLTEVDPGESVRDSALRLVRDHRLRAADAIHLASALQWCGEPPDGHEFVTFDRRLAEAARREGFVVLADETSAG
jgi:predicted nucleic acid-binding protein